MVLDKYKDELKEQRSALNVSEDQIKAWHAHPVTQSLKIDMELAVLDATDLIGVNEKSDAVYVTTDVIADQVIDYRLSETEGWDKYGGKHE